MRRIPAPALALLLCLASTGPALAATRHLGDRTLAVGVRGADVRALQRLLGEDGYRVVVDGQYGPGTRKAVRRFQRAGGLPVTGAVDKRTLAALRAAIKAAASGGASATPPQTTADSAPATTTTTTTTTSPAPDPAGQATLQNGQATAPAGAPAAVVAAIAAANHIATLPYRYGGGHIQWEDTAYDCSGAVSYALHGAGLLSAPMTSGQLASWGAAGPGTWITIYANAGHTWVVIAGLRFDTARYDTSATVKETGPRWRTGPRPTDGFTVRHPAGL